MLIHFSGFGGEKEEWGKHKVKSPTAYALLKRKLSKITKNFYMRYIYVAFTAIYVFICVQKRATKEGYKGKSEREEVQGVAEALWFVQPGAEEAEGRPHSSLHIDLYTYFVYTNVCVCVCTQSIFLKFGQRKSNSQMIPLHHTTQLIL